MLDPAEREPGLLFFDRGGGKGGGVAIRAPPESAAAFLD